MAVASAVEAAVVAVASVVVVAAAEAVVVVAVSGGNRPFRELCIPVKVTMDLDGDFSSNLFGVFLI